MQVAVSRISVPVFGLAFSFVMSVAAGVAFGQPIPPSIQPGQIIDQPAEDLRQRELRPDIIVVPDEAAGDSAGSTEKIFVLQEIVLDGVTAYDQAELAQTAAEFVGTEVSFADLNAIARAITLRYRTDGYVLSQAVLPPQEIEGGVVHLQMIEGRISGVQIIGEVRDYLHIIQKMADRITALGPTNTGDLERYLLLIDDLPGIRARGVIQPSDVPGGGQLLITVEQDRLEGSIVADNLGNRLVGPFRGTLVVAVNDVLGLHDRTTLRGIITGFEGQTRELRLGEVMQEFQVGSNGLRIRARGAFTASQPGGAARPLAVRGKGWTAEIQALYPLIRSRQFNINLLAGFRALESKTDILGIQVSEDHVRSFWFRVSLDKTDTLGGVTQVNAEVAQGANILNGTNDGIGRTRANGQHVFTRLNAQVTRIQDLTHGFSARAVVAGQYAIDPLLSSEEFALGGTTFGRAYDFAEIVGDSGVGSFIELRYNGPVPPKYVESYQLYGFADIGSVWNRNRVAGERRQVSIASTGAGIRFNLAGEVSGSVEAAVPLSRDVGSVGDHGNNVRVRFSIRKRF